MPIEPDEEAPKPASGSNGEVSVANRRPPGLCTVATVEPFALPSATAALIEPRAPSPAAFRMWKTPTTRPRPEFVSRRLTARTLNVPLRRGSLLVAVPVYVAIVVANVSPPSTVHVVRRAFETVVAENDADVVWACAPPPATATPAAASAATANGASSTSLFFDIWDLLGSMVGQEPDAVVIDRGKEAVRRR